MIPLSYIAEYSFCPRSSYWKLSGNASIGNENNTFIAEGNAVHFFVDSEYTRHKNSKTIKSSLRLFSRKYNIIGKSDVVEFLHNKEMIPVEFKRGCFREQKMHKIQLALQSLCLLEMFPDKTIKQCGVFFSGSREKYLFNLTDELLNEAKNLAIMVNEKTQKNLIPQNFSPKNDERCNGCCFQVLCAR